MRFEELGLAEPILRAVLAQGYTTPTPIQAKAIPHVLQGRDLLGCAQTGTGKTAAFALPIIHRLSKSRGGHAPHEAPTSAAHSAPGHAAAHTGHHPQHRSQQHGPQHSRGPDRKVRALILAPTRELAAQIDESFRAYGRQAHLKYAVIFGGVNQNPQTRALREGVDVVIATPGRLMDLMNQGYVDLSGVEVLVLDEADRMLDMGFIPDIRKIVAKLPATGTRQTLLFSATLPRDIRDLAGSILRNPISIEVAPEQPTADRIEQAVYFVEKRNKSRLIIHLLENSAFTRALVFTRTKHGADKVARQLHTAGIVAEAIHGNKTQGARTRALVNFKSGKTPVLIASDIAARGIDIDEISHVFNYDLPNVPETYVHRIGRTARAGASGIAISFCDPEERPYLKDIERLTRVPIPVRNDQPQYPPRSEDATHGPARPRGNHPMHGGRQGQKHQQQGKGSGGHGGHASGGKGAGPSRQQTVASGGQPLPRHPAPTPSAHEKKHGPDARPVFRGRNRGGY